jgi:holin-like protein
LRPVRVLVGVAWLWLFLAIGNRLHAWLGLPIPGSVVGMLLLWAALETGVVRLAWLDDGARSLLAILGLLFVPAGVGVVEYLDAGTVWLPAILILVGGTLLTLTVTGHVAQRAIDDRG